jgi:hypothetical protein
VHFGFLPHTFEHKVLESHLNEKTQRLPFVDWSAATRVKSAAQKTDIRSLP